MTQPDNTPESLAPTPAAPPVVVPRPPATGRRYGFLCGFCSSRLEATDHVAGQSGVCPTCGNTIVIPILDIRGRLIDPASGQIIKQDPHPVHAYAAAGTRAPQIVDVSGQQHIKCPRCDRLNPLTANNCSGCGLPFTMEGTLVDSISGTNSWAVASLVLGIITILGGMCMVVPSVLAIVFGAMAMRGSSQSGTQTGQGMAVAGIVMGVLGLLGFGLYLVAAIF